eukprot:Gregarina_sp_Poly_1__2500@NODE_1679_length_3548_cov_135_071244_g1103_i0_p1_GENE_NODE_1679_length_3548_cov_135_071244_g1103_i0NODE_1679_length_3548_cov_135_071244_g1103_i0_p1_ORF_typecomplete_len392_score37_35WD40/PF00400_32/3_2e11WD40/PF00400_32/1_7e15WD40/PF00400_32/0_0022WD40/PF00400_32/0_0011WD40/PF00400_32/6_6ANAPC4_WD40/PF12894_7/6_6e11ANAPC4_WD40/PF12894_7/3_3e11ANAPC4_WD40/PF12894_7/9_4e05ANAPC4_WD40/PF12894_7/0_0097Nup160/PF11715_8/0_4Nup160/PF11715_8/0_11Nup160/PF11715_8/0_0053Nup160/PF
MSTTKDELTGMLKNILHNEDPENVYSLVLSDHGIEINTSVARAFVEGINDNKNMSTEHVLKISFYKMASFRVRPVSRLAGSLSGHQGNVVCCAFSADGTMLVTGSGDCEARIWDLITVTPQATLSGHTRCVECVAWSPDCRWLATGSEDKTVKIWRAEANGTKFTCTHTLSHHKGVITSLAFLPLHLSKFYSSGAPLLVSAARDGSLKVFDVVSGHVLASFDGHTAMVTTVRWSALAEATPDGTLLQGPFVYSSSRDTTLRVWSLHSKTLVREIRCHGHWVNTLSCNTDSICRYGAFNPDGGKTHVDQLTLEDQIDIANRIWTKWKDNVSAKTILN